MKECHAHNLNRLKVTINLKKCINNIHNHIDSVHYVMLNVQKMELILDKKCATILLVLTVRDIGVGTVAFLIDHLQVQFILI